MLIPTSQALYKPILVAIWASLEATLIFFIILCFIVYFTTSIACLTWHKPNISTAFTNSIFYPFTAFYYLLKLSVFVHSAYFINPTNVFSPRNALGSKTHPPYRSPSSNSFNSSLNPACIDTSLSSILTHSPFKIIRTWQQFSYVFLTPLRLVKYKITLSFFCWTNLSWATPQFDFSRGVLSKTWKEKLQTRWGDARRLVSLRSSINS